MNIQGVFAKDRDEDAEQANKEVHLESGPLSLVQIQALIRTKYTAVQLDSSGFLLPPSSITFVAGFSCILSVLTLCQSVGKLRDIMLIEKDQNTDIITSLVQNKRSRNKFTLLFQTFIEMNRVFSVFMWVVVPSVHTNSSIVFCCIALGQIVLKSITNMAIQKNFNPYASFNKVAKVGL